jgi:hypothetical protein
MDPRWSRIELHLFRSYLRARKSEIVAEKPVDIDKVWSNYLRIKKLIDGGKK